MGQMHPVPPGKVPKTAGVGTTYGEKGFVSGFCTGQWASGTVKCRNQNESQHAVVDEYSFAVDMA